MIRDRAKLFFEKPGPTLTPRQLERAQPAFSDPTAKEEVRKKYIVGTTRLDIASIIKYFAAPKGKADWQVVYDATAISGLNECVWAPSFRLPKVDSLVRALDEDSWMVDRDILATSRKEGPQTLASLGAILPRIVHQSNLISAEEVVRDYVPTKSWVMKVRLDSTLASDLFTFVGRGATHWAIVLGSKQAYIQVFRMPPERLVNAASSLGVGWCSGSCGTTFGCLCINIGGKVDETQGYYSKMDGKNPRGERKAGSQGTTIR
eukprot:scaffold78001_cov41-Cyclotella_meneghiniana.AAC.2